MKKLLSNLRVRLILFTLLVAIPLLILTLNAGLQLRKQAAIQAQNDALRLARVAAINQELLLENTRGFLLAWTHMPGLNEEKIENCEFLTAHLLQTHYPFYSGFYVADLYGNILCRAGDEEPQLELCEHYHELIQSDDFVISPYHICRNTGKGVISVGYPILDENGEIKHVVNAAIDLEWFQWMAEDAELPLGSTLTVFDQDGIIVSRYPDADFWVGKQINQSFIDAMIQGEAEGTTEIVDADGLKRLYAYTQLWSVKGKVVLAIGIPSALAYAETDRTTWRNMIALGFVTILVILVAWYVGGLFILDPTQSLISTIRDLSEGKLDARIDYPYEGGELGAISHAVDRMAESLALHESERRKAENAIKEYTQELERSNRELQDFVGIASHDLQEPLRKVRIFSDLLLTRYAEGFDERGTYYLKSVADAAQRMQLLIQDLLSYTRVTTRAQPFSRVKLEKIVQEAMQDLDHVIDQTDAVVELDTLPTIEADVSQMRQLFQNLLGNALKFHKENEPPVVRIYEGQVDQGLNGFVKIVVQDQGIGFDTKYLDRIFLPFECLHPRGKYEGAGMGLAICRKIVERHGGAITAESTPGSGASFIVTLPVQDITKKERGS